MAATSATGICCLPGVQNLSRSQLPSIPHGLLLPGCRAPWQSQLMRPYSIPQASRRVPNSFYRASDVLLNQSRGWGRMNHGGEDDDEMDDDEEEDGSLDLLVRFVENVFKKISRRARKAVKSVLPVPISPRLIGFSVNGALILGFLWILKAFLEVICTLGSVVYVSILLIRGLWSGLSYLQENRNFDLHPVDDEDGPIWTGAQPVT